MDGIFTFRKIESFSNNDIEVFANEVVRVENAEVIYTDVAVQVYFSMENLGDQEIFNEPDLEVQPLGTCGNYRLRIQVIVILMCLNN